jgi:hypothetical protein
VVSAADLFSADLQILSRRLGVAFVAEGQPFPVTKEAPAPSLNLDLAQEDAVREVADYFDYSAVRQGKVYLLTKRYTDPEELPDVTPEECRRGFKAISQILAAFNPRIPPDTFSGSPVANIANLLSAPQLKRLGDGGLPVSELTPTQHAEVWKLALYFYLQTQADHVEAAWAEMESRNPADPVFHWATVEGIYAFGYDTRSVNLNKMLFIPVSNSNRIVIAPNGGMMKRSGFHTQNGVVVADPDLTDPAGVSEEAKQFLTDRGKAAHAVSLTEVIKTLNERPAAGEGGYKVDAMYAGKTVTLVGTALLPPDVLLRSLASVYGLRVARTEAGTSVLTYPMIFEAKQLSDVSRSLRSAIPAPLYRVIQSRLVTSRRRVSFAGEPAMLIDYSNAELALKRSSMRQFRYLAEMQVKAQTQGQMALSRFATPAPSLFEIASLARDFSNACWFADRSLPPYIADFEHITLMGGLYNSAEGQKRFALSFSYTDPKTGETHQGVGFTNAIVPP